MPCSGIHRSLGTHITQVRSVDLDKWKPEWVEVMKTWGNTKANAVWEAKMPKGYDGRPNETEAQELTQKLQKFIRDKYERKKWYSETGSKKKKESSEEESEEEESEEEVKPKKAAPKAAAAAAAPSAASSTAKKPVIVMKTGTSTTAPAVKAKPTPAPAVVDNLLDDFDPFGDSSFTPVFPTAPAPVSSVQITPAAVTQVPVSQAAPAKPTFDLNSLYGMSSQQPAMSPTTWGAPPASQQQPMFSSGFPAMSQQPLQQQSQGGLNQFGGFQSIPTPSFPQQQQPPMMAGMQQFPQQTAFPPQQAFNMYNQPQMQFQQQQPMGGGGMWPAPQQPMQPQQQPMGNTAAPTQGRPASNSDPFSGLF